MCEPYRVAFLVDDLIALIGERKISVLAVVSGQRQVAQGMQPRLLEVLPFRPKLGLPFLGQRFVLRKNVLDGVVFDVDALFLAVVLQAAQPVATATEVVKVAQLDVALKLLVVGEAPVGRHQQEGGFDAFEVAVLL